MAPLGFNRLLISLLFRTLELGSMIPWECLQVNPFFSSWLFLIFQLFLLLLLLDEPIWKSKASSNVQVFVWTAVLNQINTIDMLQKCRPLTAVSPKICIMRGSDFESRPHFFYIARQQNCFGISCLGFLKSL